MLFQKGEKILVSHRRLYEEDRPRYFVGAVERYERGMAKITGYSWFWPAVSHIPVRKEDVRTKIFPLGSGTLFAYALPSWVDVALARFEASEDGRLLFTARPGFELDIGEEHYPRREPRRLTVYSAEGGKTDYDYVA